MKKTKQNIETLASEAGVSIATISRYFNNPKIVAKKSRIKIEAAIQKVGYKENRFARMLAKGESEFVGLIIPHLEFDFYGAMLKALLHETGKYNLKCIVFSGDTSQNELDYIAELETYRIKGIITLSHTLPSKTLRSLDVRVVGIEREFDYISCVCSDNYSGGKKAAQKLIRDECDHLILLRSKSSHSSPSDDRYAAFQDTCSRRNIPFTILDCPFTKDTFKDYRLLQDIVQNIEATRNGKKIGIFLPNDNHASLLLNVLTDHHCRVPEDYEIIGFDGASIGLRSQMKLSTISQNIPELAQKAVQLLLREDTKLQQERIPVKLMNRDTTI